MQIWISHKDMQEIVSFSPILQKKYLLLLILDSFSPTFYYLIHSFSSYYMHMFIKLIEDIHEAPTTHLRIEIKRIYIYGHVKLF